MRNYLRISVLVVLLFSLFSASAFAAPKDVVSSDSLEITKNSKRFHVEIKEKAKGKVNTIQVEQILDQAIELHPNQPEYNIYIEDVVTESEVPLNILSSADLSVANYHWYDTGSTYFTSKQVVSTNNPTAANFVISVAKGQTVQLGYNYSFTVSSSYSAQAGMPSGAGANVQGSLSASATKTYSSTTTWTGPPETSTYNSRTYYTTGYKTYGNYTTYQYGNISGDLHATWTGSYQDAQSNFTSWSLDTN
ncbi:hypothetical protein SAMN04487895_104407 [Paenibacillus sophorae]|uniref:Uncharacterized protein n=1 Tax=Paenibacillus sophorae TaxID=1333845 RepID=A0A1H8LME9_9BACL|nr:hypothetical protein [Paenibacillus sophorae]QWU17228.1 hypothetical protein KP014_08735 [Paenibacillus sophorae]SEO06331.1 hypothetical protein SAMN04487895_104407 [Paenibacillus sophorae]